MEVVLDSYIDFIRYAFFIKSSKLSIYFRLRVGVRNLINTQGEQLVLCGAEDFYLK